MDSLTELLGANGFLVTDGAIGTQLFAAGLMAGDPPEVWNLEHPDRIRAIHQSYVDAGSDIILTNSFGGNRHRLKLHSMEGRVHQLNVAAAAIGRDVADSADRRVLVAGSMGPTGDLIRPLGELTSDEAQVAFAEQAAGLADGGADILWMETAKPGLDQAADFAAGIKDLGKFGGYNLSPSFNWDASGMTDAQMDSYCKDLGKLGFQFQFITLAGFHCNGK